MSQSWDAETDLLVAGTGAAALSAAITAAVDGDKAIVVESTARWGGSTMLSGGGLWMPANPLMLRDGTQDSVDRALLYMEDVIDDVGPASSRARKLAFLRTVPTVMNLLAAEGVRWTRAKDYPDYYPDRPGGMIGRAIEVEPFDSKQLGDWFARSRHDEGVPLPVKTDDVWLLARAWSTPSGFVRGTRFVARALSGLLRGKRLRGSGGALSMSLMQIVLEHRIPVWLETPLESLVQDRSGAVIGAVVLRDGRPFRVRARKGVVIGTGGFAHNTAWRERYHGVPGWSSTMAGDMGGGIQAGIDAGAATALMDDAWWGSAIPLPEGRVAFSVWERSFPFSVVVDSQGRRFTNESESYIDFGHALLERSKTAPLPAWMIFESRHRRRYMNAALLGRGRELKRDGTLVKCRSLVELADAIGVERGILAATIERFNGFAASGVDEEYGRGRTAYDNYYGDPRVRPNPNLGAIARAPFYAVRIVPGDLGTKGGLLTDEHARVLRDDGAVIDGLYAAGNSTASVMGRTYPGAGSTLGPAVAFGYLAARHAAGRGA